VIAFAALGDGDKAGELFRMLNPITHTFFARERAALQSRTLRRRGDVYAEPPHVGRGGWTWYTGSSAGSIAPAWNDSRVPRPGTVLSIDPCIPRKWSGYSVRFRYHSPPTNHRRESAWRESRHCFHRSRRKAFVSRADIPLTDDVPSIRFSSFWVNCDIDRASVSIVAERLGSPHDTSS